MERLTATRMVGESSMLTILWITFSSFLVLVMHNQFYFVITNLKMYSQPICHFTDPYYACFQVGLLTRKIMLYGFSRWFITYYKYFFVFNLLFACVEAYAPNES